MPVHIRDASNHSVRPVTLIAIAASVLIGTAAIIMMYHTDSSESENQLVFLDIADHTIIQQKDEPLFLSVTTSEKIPTLLQSNSMGYGYGWFESDTDVLSGYTVNIHTQDGIPEWHAESITISDSDRFCFDDATLVAANVIVDQYKLNVIFERNDTIQFDRIVSYEIVSDHSCNFGMAGVMVDQIDVK